MQNEIPTTEEQKPKSIKIIGLLISLFAGFMILANAMGAVTWSVMGMGEGLGVSTSKETGLLPFILKHYVAMCIVMLTIGVAYLISGLFIRKYRLWANRLVTVLLSLMIVIIWVLMIAIFISSRHVEEMKIFSYFTLFNALFWSTPIGLLIWFFNKKKIKKYFT